MVIGMLISSVFRSHDQAEPLVHTELGIGLDQEQVLFLVPICGVNRIPYRQTVNKQTVMPA